MKLLCLSQDPALTSQIQEECVQQQWPVRVVGAREELISSITEYGPDMLLIDVTSIADLDWWQVQGQAILGKTPAPYRSFPASKM